MMLCIVISVLTKAVKPAQSYAIVDSQSTKTGPDAREMVGFDARKKVKGRNVTSLSTHWEWCLRLPCTVLALRARRGYSSGM